MTRLAITLSCLICRLRCVTLHVMSFLSAQLAHQVQQQQSLNCYPVSCAPEHYDAVACGVVVKNKVLLQALWGLQSCDV